MLDALFLDFSGCHAVAASSFKPSKQESGSCCKKTASRKHITQQMFWQDEGHVRSCLRRIHRQDPRCLVNPGTRVLGRLLPHEGCYLELRLPEDLLGFKNNQAPKPGVTHTQ